MNLNFNFITLLLVLTLLNCKNENTFSEYKYADQNIVLTACGEDFNSKLYHEALYAFENDILIFYSKTNKNASQIQAYNRFIRSAVYERIKYEDIVSAHTLKVFEALKNENTLWDANNTKSHLNYNSPIISCVASNIQDTALKTTFNSLVTTNSMSPELFGEPLISKYRTAIKDKYLATYIALDLFYSKLFYIDFSKVNLNKPESKVDFNKKPE